MAADALPEFGAAPGRIVSLRSTIPLFQPLHQDEIMALASSVRPIVPGPVERISLPGQPGPPLFILAEGELEALVRQQDGCDLGPEPGVVPDDRSVVESPRTLARKDAACEICISGMLGILLAIAGLGHVVPCLGPLLHPAADRRFLMMTFLGDLIFMLRLLARAGESRSGRSRLAKGWRSE